MRRLIALTAVATCLLAAGCNTMSGMGKDISSAGRAVSGAANDARK